MKKTAKSLTSARWKRASLAAAALIVVLWLMLYRLGSLVGGLSVAEYHTAIAPVGWHGIYHNAFYLPLTLVRSVDFFIFAHHGQMLTRLPNTLFGVLSLVSFVWLVKLWHGKRAALLAGCLFAASAWLLHVSRLASFDVLYLCAVPMLLLANAFLQRHYQRTYAYYGSLVLWGFLLYVPGLVWILGANLYLQRSYIAKGWRHFGRWWQRVLYVLVGLLWLPLLVVNLGRPGMLRAWLGLPVHIAGPLTLLKHFVGVFVHIFIRGPQYPQTWLDRTPVLDIFTLILCIVGILFYSRHAEASRSRLLAVFSIIGVILVALGGPVGLSLLIPIAYLLAATGLTYLLRDWLKVFPANPLARNLGIGLVCAAVALSCVYNLRAYFVAWPHADATKVVFDFRYHP